MMFSTRAVFVLTFVWLTAHTVSQGQVFLQYNLTPKQAFSYESTSSVTQSMSAMDQDVASTTTIATKLHITVKDAVVRQYTVECRYDTARIRLQTQGAEGMLPPDSAITLPMLANKTETLTLSPRGTILSTTANDTDDLQVTMSSMSAMGGTGAKAVFPEFAGKELAVGDSWTVTTTDTVSRSQMPGSILTTSKLRYTFLGVVDTLGVRCARIGVQSEEMSMTGTMQAMGMDMALDGEGETHGTTYVEISTGMQVVSRLSSTLNARMSMTGQGQAIVPITTETITTLRRLP